MNRVVLAAFAAFSFALIAVSAPAVAQTNPPADGPPGKWTADDVVMAESAGQFEISPDGHWAAWVKRTADKEKNAHVSNLVLSSLTEKKEIELTRGTESHAGPKWSPNGQRIAFVSTRPVPKAKPEAPDEDGPRPQLWLINPFGGEPWHLTESPRGVRRFEWADDDTIIFAAPEDPTLYENTIKEKKDTSLVVEDEPHAPPVRLFKLTIKSKTASRLTDNEDRIQDFALSPDGNQAVTIHDRSLRFVYDQKIKPATFLYDLKTGQRQQLFADGKINPERVRWARDGKGFYVSSSFSSHPVYLMATISLMFYYDLAGETATQVHLDWDNGLASGGDYEVTGDGFIALLASGARHKFARYARQADGKTWARTWIEGDHVGNIFGFKLGKDDRALVYQFTTAGTPDQWYRATLDGGQITSPTQFTEINPVFKKRTISKTELVRWKGANDEEVEGILYYPHQYEAGKKYPLVVMIHGGPAGADFDAWDESWAYPQNLMSERGAFVLKPNYHGSSNYGLKWVESISGGNYYDLELVDIEKGVDHLIGRGLVDPDKLAALGWSNGSILTIGLTVTTTRYKVASAGAGDVDWSSDWGNCEFGGAFDQYYLGASPLDNPDVYIQKSPFFKMKNVKTPTIIFFGTEDKAVPTQQGWMHYRALQQLGQTDVRFILFPGEPHSLRKLMHQKRKIEEDLVWFDKYLFKTVKEESEALKPESPLAVALKLKSAKRAAGRYGVMEKGALIPETIKKGALELGRFEVTRAQYAAFDKTYLVEPGKENYPANGISYEKAKAYCEWLSKLTGQTYRLGNEAEMEPIYSAAKEGENTLDYWAGYSVNPDDAARLAQKLKELDGAAPLLKEVGLFKATAAEGEEMIFDLGGNVAEWVMAKDGSGKVLGGSADAPADPKLRQRSPGAQYQGFRVVKGAPVSGQ
jgi:dipeptidyl aminopeptidase/acylaminoacyl peptidase